MKATWQGLFPVLLVLFALGARAQIVTHSDLGARLLETGSRHVRVHDPSTIVKCSGEFWVFCTGPGIRSYHSSDLIHWQTGPPVFTNAPAWVAQIVPGNRRLSYWAPDVMTVDDRWLLYYAVSTFGINRSVVGLATNPTLDPADPKFHWTDQGIVVQSTNTDNFNTIDPAVTRDADGNLWLAFGSFWGGVKLIQLDPATGIRIATNSPVYSLAFNTSIEASYLFHHDQFYYLFVNWGICCRGTNSTYENRPSPIPAYPAGEPEPNPLFISCALNSQGAEGRA